MTNPPRMFVVLTSTVETCVIPESCAASRIEPFPKFINPHKTEVPLEEPLFAPIVPSAHTGVNVVQEANNIARAANEPKSTFFHTSSKTVKHTVKFPKLLRKEYKVCNTN